VKSLQAIKAYKVFENPMKSSEVYSNKEGGSETPGVRTTLVLRCTLFLLPCTPLVICLHFISTPPYFTRTSPILHPHLTHTPPALHPYSTRTSPILHPHLTHTPPALYPSRTPLVLRRNPLVLRSTVVSLLPPW
jgi:hypothetical protein